MKEFLKTILYKPLYNLLIFFAWLVPGHSIGWAIIILTLLIRFILLPSSLKTARSQVKLQALQPKMNKIRSEIKDQQQQGQALMKLYKDEGVSPFGSCLPMLIQLPIIFILYRVFSAGLNESRYAYIYSFVPHTETINTFFFGLNLATPERWFLPLVAGLSQFILSKMTMPAPTAKTETDNADPMAMMNKQMLFIFPLMTLFLARSLPAALSLYWIVTTLFGIAQQYYVNQSIKKEKLAVSDELNIEDYKNLPSPTSKQSIQQNKSDMVSKMMKKKMEKTEKKTGVEVTIRTKK